MRAIIFVILIASACASCSDLNVVETYLDPRDNPINQTLNHEHEKVLSTVEQWNDSAVKLLSSSLPICIAYVMPTEGPGLTAKLQHVISLAQATAPKLAPHITIYQLKNPQRPNAANDFQYLQTELSRGWAQASIDFRTVNYDAFSQIANCREKETIMARDDQLLFYIHSIPNVTLNAGPISTNRVLFIAIEAP